MTTAYTNTANILYRNDMPDLMQNYASEAGLAERQGKASQKKVNDLRKRLQVDRSFLTVCACFAADLLNHGLVANEGESRPQGHVDTLVGFYAAQDGLSGPQLKKLRETVQTACEGRKPAARDFRQHLGDPVEGRAFTPDDILKAWANTLVPGKASGATITSRSMLKAAVTAPDTAEKAYLQAETAALTAFILADGDTGKLAAVRKAALKAAKTKAADKRQKAQAKRVA